MVLTVSFALSSVTGLSCHRRLLKHFSRLDISVGISGPHDFAVCGSVLVQPILIRPDAIRIHRIPHPTFVTIAKRPSCGHETVWILAVIWGLNQRPQTATNWHDGQISLVSAGSGPRGRR
jgi:hypothetical protein